MKLNILVPLENQMTNRKVYDLSHIMMYDRRRICVLLDLFEVGNKCANDVDTLKK